MRQSLRLLIMGCLAFLVGCETVVSYELPINQTKIVVEGSIENDVFPLVILSRSFPFFGDIDFNDLESLLISGAIIKVSDRTREVELMEYNKDELLALSEEDFNKLAPAIEQFIGFEITQSTIDTFYSFIPNFTFYTVKPEDDDFVGVFGKSYDLTINLINNEIFGTTELTATTYIPYTVALDSLWVEDHPNAEIDTLFQLRTRLNDPDTSGNFYRGFTRVNEGAWLTSFNSVFDDAFLEGESVPFTVLKGISESEKLETIDFDVNGYWESGDTAEVKISMINNSHYQFWRTVENEKNNLGSPFGSYTILESNIVGERAVGIWGGYGSTISRIIIP